jgi:hypothetical protein
LSFAERPLPGATVTWIEWKRNPVTTVSQKGGPQWIWD